MMGQFENIPNEPVFILVEDSLSNNTVPRFVIGVRAQNKMFLNAVYKKCCLQHQRTFIAINDGAVVYMFCERAMNEKLHTVAIFCEVGSNLSCVGKQMLDFVEFQSLILNPRPQTLWTREHTDSLLPAQTIPCFLLNNLCFVLKRFFN